MRVRAALYVTLLSLAPALASAQERSVVPIVLTMLPMAGAPEPRLEAVLRGTIELALAPSPFRVEAELRGVDESAGLELTLLYAQAARRVALRLSFNDASGFLPTREEAVDLELDPRFDQAAAAFVRAALDEAAALMGARLAATAPAQAAPPGLAVTPAADGRPALPAPPPAPMAGYAPAKPRGAATSFEAGLGALFPLGEMGAYFDAAPRTHATIGRYLKADRRWRLGAAASFMAFSVSGESPRSARNVVAQLGGELLYSFGPESAFDPWLSAAFGPALVVAGVDAESPLLKALPYLSLSLGAAIRLQRSLRLALGLSWSLYLDYGSGSRYSLMGLNPNIALRSEL